MGFTETRGVHSRCLVGEKHFSFPDGVEVLNNPCVVIEIKTLRLLVRLLLEGSRSLSGVKVCSEGVQDRADGQGRREGKPGARRHLGRTPGRSCDRSGGGMPALSVLLSEELVVLPKKR